jgi:uncharacterized membrane protein YcaP (DUF421 family)
VEIVARASITFLLVFLLTRGLRKRALSDMTPFEMILLVTLGDIIQQGVTQEDYSLTGSALAISTFGFWIMVLTWASWRSARVRKIVEGVPIILVRDGEPVDEALRMEQMPLEEILEAARQEGVADLAEVRFAILEVSGRISIIKRS